MPSANTKGSYLFTSVNDITLHFILKAQAHRLQDPAERRQVGKYSVLEKMRFSSCFAQFEFTSVRCADLLWDGFPASDLNRRAA